LIILALATIVTTLPAFGQSEAQKRDRNRDLESKERIKQELLGSQFRFGRFFVLSKFEIGSPAISQLSNVSYEIDQPFYIPALDGKDDFVIFLRAPQRVYAVLNRKVLVSVDAVPSYLYYVRSTEFRDFGWLVRGDLHFLFNRLYLDFYTGLSDQLGRTTSELRTLVPEKQSNWGSHGELKISSRTDIDFGSTHRDYTFGETDLGEFFFRDIRDLDRTESSYNATIRHQTFPIASLAIGSQVTAVNFDRPDVSDARQTSSFIELSRKKGATTLTIRPGYSKLDYDDPTLEDYSGFTGFAGLQIDHRSHWALGLSAERRLEFSLFGRNNHYAADRVRLNGSKHLGSRLEIHATVEEGRNDYFVPTPTTTLGDLQVRRDDLSYQAAGFTIQISRLVTGLTLGHWTRDSNVAGFDDDGIRLLLHLSFSPGTRAGG